MTNPPAEVTTPPEGYEWTGDLHEKGNVPAVVAVWTSTGWKASNITNQYYAVGSPVIRKVKPPTVTVELPRKTAEHWAAVPWRNADDQELIDACREALAREGTNDS